MTNKIIALVDGSTYSQSVCDHAAWVSGRTGAPVELLHVLGRREAVEKADLSGSIRLGARTALLEELAALDEQRAKLVAHRGRAILDDAREVLVKDGVDEITTRLRHGDLIDTVAEQEAEASMILVGKRGEAADFAKLHLGSNVERIVRASHKPVMVASRAFKPIERMLIAYDASPSAVRAVDHIARNPLYSGLEMTLVTVGAETPATTKALEDATAMLKAAGIDARTRITAGQPDAALGQMVEAEGFNMLVMGAYGHSRIRSLIIGSTTTAMVRSCRVPVVMVR
ncbi:MAG: universal stress protein [Pseudomonadota bacterium]